jgi:hypothetical protein
MSNDASACVSRPEPSLLAFVLLTASRSRSLFRSAVASFFWRWRLRRSFLTVGWRKVWETNVWMGGPLIRTPTHYDLLHNFYVQVQGKRYSRQCRVAVHLSLIVPRS